MKSANDCLLIQDEINAKNGGIKVWSDGTIEIPHIGISILSVYGFWEKLHESIQSKSIRIIYKKTVIAQIQYPKNITKYMTNLGPESVEIKVDETTNSLYATSITVTLRRLLACAGSCSEINQRRNWKLFLNNHRIGLIRIKMKNKTRHAKDHFDEV